MGERKDTVIIYTRLHKKIDKIVMEAAEQIHSKKATYVRYILKQYTGRWFKEHGDTFPEGRESLGFSPLSPSFFVSRGRASQSALADPMNITLPRKDAELLQRLALKYGYSEAEIRTAILVTFLHKHDLL